MSFLFRTLFWLGGLAIVFGGLAFGSMLGLLFLYGYPQGVAVSIAVSLAVPAGILGLACDALFDFSTDIHKLIWQSQQDTAREHLRNKEISYRQALSKYFNAAYKLTQPPSLLLRLLSGQSDDVNKEELSNQLWIVRYALKLIEQRSRPENIYALDSWLPIVEELSEELAKERTAQTFFQRKVVSWFNPEKLAQRIAYRWQDRRINSMLSESSQKSVSDEVTETPRTDRPMLSEGSRDTLAEEFLENRREKTEKVKVPRENTN